MLDINLLEIWSKPVSSDVNLHAQRVWKFLSEENGLPEPTGNELLFVHGNWYDRGKVRRLIELQKHYPDARIVIAGGVGRLTNKKSEELGGEALEMKQFLEEHGISLTTKQNNLPIAKVIFYTGARQTGDNVDFLLYWRERIYGDKKPRIIGIDESYLLRRVRATTIGRMLERHETPKELYVITSGTQSFNELVKLHNSHPKVALYFLVSEVDRLNDYSRESNTPYIFPHDVAFQNAEEYGGIESITQSAELLRTAHEFEQARQITGPGYGAAGNREIMLQLFAPTYS
ncbi:MAG: hypothetical protein HYS80_00410 [Candidatus Aenigmarchaeota archaeon]|nr:hypothetical protein [Candidatus Aenigmarchaeota archaeon]